MVDAAVPVVLLGHNHHRHVHAFQHSPVLGGENAGQENHPVYSALAQGVQIFHLTLRAVGGVGQQHPVALVAQHQADTVHHPGGTLAAEPGQHHPDLPGAAGAQTPGRLAGGISGTAHRLLNGGSLLGAEVSVVKVSADRCFGNSCQRCKFGNVHTHSPFQVCDGPFPPSSSLVTSILTILP